jgi:hypothetical protein
MRVIRGEYHSTIIGNSDFVIFYIRDIRGRLPSFQLVSFVFIGLPRRSLVRRRVVKGF